MKSETVCLTMSQYCGAPLYHFLTRPSLGGPAVVSGRGGIGFRGPGNIGWDYQTLRPEGAGQAGPAKKTRHLFGAARAGGGKMITGGPKKESPKRTGRGVE